MKSVFIIFYTSTIFIFLIFTIIIVTIDLIYNFLTNKISMFNTKYNMQNFLSLIIFGIIGIIYLFLLNNLGYENIIYLTDSYLIITYIISSFLLFTMLSYKIDNYYLINTRLNYTSTYRFIKYIKEKDVKIRNVVLVKLSSLIVALGIFSFQYIFMGLVPWYIIIFILFYLSIIYEIILKKYFLNKTTFYQDLYELGKYFNKRLVIFFGILVFIAVFDTLNKLEPLEPIYLTFLSLGNILCFWFYYILYYFFNSLNYYLHHYIFQKNIDYKIDDKEIKIKNIQVNPIITLLSYLALFIVFIINLML